jgi:hypothetical protein
MRHSKLVGLIGILVLTGCFHQVVRTGAPPGNVVIERPWTATYLLGLVPASAINTAAQCPTGVAVVETQQTFANGLVGALTLGIYTPQSVRITCAAGTTAMSGARQIRLPVGASLDERSAAVKNGLVLAHRTGEPVVIVLSEK